LSAVTYSSGHDYHSALRLPDLHEILVRVA
jgi:hypothetical protein